MYMYKYIYMMYTQAEMPYHITSISLTYVIVHNNTAPSVHTNIASYA